MAAYNIKAALRAAKNMQYEPIEVKVREATNNDPWGVSTSAMSDIARATHHHDEYALLFKMVWKRLSDHEHVMHVQKSLILIDYLLRNGAERFISDAKRRARDISALQKYKQYDANNRDVGGDVRAKAKAVYELLTNESKLTDERSKAQTIRDVKLSGIGNDGFGGAAGHGGAAREFDDDRYNRESPKHGGREQDWEKDENDASPQPNKHRRKKAAQDDNEDDDEAKKADNDEEQDGEADEPVKEKKKKKSKSAAAAVAADAEAEVQVDEGEKKKKKKKKKSSAESADTTAPPSVEPSAPGTPSAFAPSAAPTNVSFDSFDAFGAPPENFLTSSMSNSGAATPAANIAAPAAGDKAKKSRKKKDATSEAAAAPTFLSASSSAQSVSINTGGDYDLTNFASIATPRGPGGDLDILTGTNAPAAPLEDMFAQSSLMDGPMDQLNNGAEEDGFMIEDEPALLDQHFAPSVISPRGAKSPQAAKKPSDIWDLASDFTNIDNIHGNAPIKKQNQQEVVSMSMMRSMQPFGTANERAASQQQQQHQQSSPFFGAPGGQGGAAMNGFGGGFGAPSHPMGQMNSMGGGGGFPPAFGQMPGGFGAPQFGGMPGAMNMGGAPTPSAFDTDLPFAAPAGSANRNKMPANGRPVVFDVPQARPQQAVQHVVAGAAPTGPRWR